MAYDAVVFDNDGVLVTPTRRRALETAIQRAFARTGVDDPRETDLERLIRPTRPELESIAGRYGIEPASLWRAREKAAIEVQRAEIAAGEKTLYDDVASISTLSVPSAIVSNNQHETIEHIVEVFGLDWFDPCLGREPTIDGIERKKPEPYYLEQALECLDAENPLYVGDRSSDIAAANAVGIDSAFVRRAHRADHDLRYSPTMEIESLEALVSVV